MTAYVGWNSGTYSADDYTQDQLRDRWEVTYADTVFLGIIGVNLLPYVGSIIEVFGPPRSSGLHFRFADGTREEFIRRVDPQRAPPKTLSLAMRSKTPAPALVPDNPRPSDPSWGWRNAAAANGIGVSYRQADTGTSLHIADDSYSADVHVDRNGFIMQGPNGETWWDLNGLLRHVTQDLEGDHAAWAMVSAGVVDKEKRPIIQATLAPWVVVDLPSQENGGRWELKVGYALTGRFR
jgi:hypothetical protein